MPTLERVPDRSPAMLRTVATALGALLCAAPALAEEYPRVELVYQHMPFDLSCEQWRNTKIEQSWKEEIESKIAAYQEFWNKEAPLLLEAVVSEVGKPFQRKEMLAVLTLCPISSMGRRKEAPGRRFCFQPSCFTNYCIRTSGLSRRPIQSSWKSIRTSRFSCKRICI